MPDLKIDYEPTSRQKSRQARLQAIADSRPAPIRVFPANDSVRRLIKHPSGIGFRDSSGSDWPHDSFTTRRIADGSVVVGGAPAAKAASKDDNKGKNKREIVAARRPKEVPPMRPISAAQQKPAEDQQQQKPGSGASPPKQQ